jgi:hypothetical protein
MVGSTCMKTKVSREYSSILFFNTFTLAHWTRLWNGYCDGRFGLSYVVFWWMVAIFPRFSSMNGWKNLLHISQGNKIFFDYFLRWLCINLWKQDPKLLLRLMVWIVLNLLNDWILLSELMRHNGNWIGVRKTLMWRSEHTHSSVFGVWWKIDQNRWSGELFS